MSTQDNVSRAGDQITQRNLGTQPIITIRPGTPFGWWFTRISYWPLRAGRSADMPDLKLAKLPDRNPIKLSIAVTPDLHQALLDYTALYAATYSREEPVTELTPAMLSAFLESDRVFTRGRASSK